MAQNTEQTRKQDSQEPPKDPQDSASQEKHGPLRTDRGTTTIDDQVVQKIAAATLEQVKGVHAIGTAARRALNSLAERIPGASTNVSGGIGVEKGEEQAVLDLVIVVEYGHSIVDVSRDVRESVIAEVEHATGLEVLEVNIEVSDVHLPSEDDPDPDSDDARDDLR